MNRPEPIELENNLGPDAVTGEINRVPWMAYDVDEMDLYIAEIEQKLAEKDKELESLKASHYAEMVDAGMRERRLRKALWLARAERAKTIAKLYSKEAELTLLREHYPSGCGFCHVMNNKWRKVEQLCRAKAEEYK